MHYLMKLRMSNIQRKAKYRLECINKKINKKTDSENCLLSYQLKAFIMDAE